MTENTDIEAEPNSPAEAFEDLRREVAFMRKVIERMADDQRAAPDYSETLGRMADGLTTASKSLGWLTQRPIVQTTAEAMAHEISEAGNMARAADERTIADATRALKDTNRELSGWIASARRADDQDRQLWRFSAAAAAAGAIIGVTLALTSLRFIPEYSAVWLLGKDRWNAGQQLMASADPERWMELEAFADLDRRNRQTVIDCIKKTNRAGQDRRCYLTFKAPIESKAIEVSIFESDGRTDGYGSA